MKEIVLLFGVLAALPLVEVAGQPPYQTGWPQEVARGVDFSSPVLADVDGDDTLEVVVASNDKLVYLWSHRGELYPNWPQETAGAPGSGETSSPAVGDIDADGEMEIIHGSYVGAQLLAWETDGSSVSGFPVSLGDAVIRCSATLEDIGETGTLEICIGTGSAQYRILVFDHTGTQLWSRTVAGRVHSTAAVGDVDHDGDLEIVHGTDDATPAGEVYAWHHNGDTLSGWPRIVGHHVDGGPALADINGDDSLEVFVGSIDNYLYGWDHHGNNLPGWPKLVGSGSVYEGIVSSPAVGDIDNDTTNGLEIIVGRGIIQSATGRLLAYHQNGDEVIGFPIDLSGSVTSSPALADVDGDGDLEIFVGCQNGSLYAYHHTASPVADFPVFVSPYGITSSPALADIDSDGDIELAVGGKGSSSGGNDSMYVWDLPGPYDPSKAPWPMFHHDEWHTGLYGKETGGVGVEEVPNQQLSISNEQLSMPNDELLRNYPNPFTRTTTILYSVQGSRALNHMVQGRGVEPALSEVEGGQGSNVSTCQRINLSIYDLSGRLVRVLVDRSLPTAYFLLPTSVVWDGTTEAGAEARAGVYFCRLQVGQLQAVRKMVLVR